MKCRASFAILIAFLAVAAGCTRYVPVSIADAAADASPLPTRRITLVDGTAYVAGKVVLADSLVVISHIHRVRRGSDELSVPTDAVVPMVSIKSVERIDTHSGRTMVLLVTGFVALAVLVTGFATFGRVS